MRTTLTFDDELAALLKRRAREDGVSFKDAVNRALRAGLGEECSKARRPAAPKTIAHSFGFKAGINLDKLRQLADELEAEAYAASLRKSHSTPRRKRPRSHS